MRPKIYYTILIAVIMLILSGLVVLWYGLSAGLLMAAWPVYYFGRLAKEIEIFRDEAEQRQVRRIQAMNRTLQKKNQIKD